MFKFLTRPLVITIIIVVAIISVAAVRNVKKSQQPPYETVIVSRANVVQEVTVTGRVQPSENVDLAFQKGGRVAAVNVVVGIEVKRGAVLVSLDSGELSAQLLQYRAAVDVARAHLAAAERGTRPEEIVIAKTKVENAGKVLEDAEANLSAVENKAIIDLANLYSGVTDLLRDTYTKADDAVTKQTDELFNNDLSSDPELTFTTIDAQAKSDAESLRIAMTALSPAFKADLDSLDAGETSLDAAMVRATERLESVLDFLNAVNSALNSAINASASTVTSYKANVNTGRTNVTTVLTSISTKQQTIAAQRIINENNITTAEAKVNDANNALASAEVELKLTEAGSTAEELAQVAAEVRQAEANVLNIQAQLSQTILTAPIEGVVTKQDAKVGEIVMAGTPVVSLIATSAYEIEANVPEVDIPKIRIGNSARVTLDAYGSDVEFEAAVVAVDPAETIIDGVATYKVTLQFTNNDERVKSGMTANVDIIGEMRENVLVVPQRAVTRENGTTSVRVLSEGVSNEVTITTGLRGSDGSVEVLSGLSEGDSVITSPITP